MENHIQQLLDEVETISKHYNELLDLSGERFNVFSVLQIENSEVRLHSRLLTDLLNPKGCHGLKDTFLKVFVEQLGLLGINSGLDTKNATAIPESYIGPKSEEEGGRIDIAIKDDADPKILIENKIYAGDQENQLLRYHNRYPKAILLYLTRDGDEPSEDSTGIREDLLQKKKYWKCISYKHDILKWLENCRKESVSHPAIRETITQYINLVKKITGQNINNKMSEEIVNIILKSSESLAAYRKILGSAEALHNQVLKKFKEDLCNIAKRRGLKFDAGDLWWEKDEGFNFTSPKLDSLNIMIRFEFSNTKFRELCYGFCYKNMENKSLTPIAIKEKFAEVVNQKVETSEAWPCWSWWPNWIDFDSNLEEIYAGTFSKNIDDQLKLLVGIASECTPIGKSV